VFTFEVELNENVTLIFIFSSLGNLLETWIGVVKKGLVPCRLMYGKGVLTGAGL